MNTIVQELHQHIQSQKPYFLIDVRRDDEWQLCHIEHAHHIPLNLLAQNLDKLPKDKPIFLMCHHGGRSLKATEFLHSKGFPNAINVIGGIDAWSIEIDPALKRY